MQATIKDVAHRAEVSVGTVSRVLRGEPNVPDSTISKVQKAITALNYSRLRKPRAVHAEKPLLKKNIGLLLLGMDRSLANLPSVASGIHGAEAALNDAGEMSFSLTFHLLIDCPRCSPENQCMV